MMAIVLSEGQRVALSLLPIWGLPGGHNLWPDIEYVDPDDPEKTACSGEDMNAIIRLGLAETGARQEDAGVHLIDGDRECEARWRIELTDAGRTTLGNKETDRHG